MIPLIPATPAHAMVLAAIHAESFPAGQRWGPDAMALQLKQPNCFGHIDPAGGFILARIAADEAEILTIAVALTRRRAGSGQALLSAAIATATRYGAKSMFLEVSLTNDAAQALYARLGFTQVGRRQRYYPDGGDALVMRRDLGP
jgi:ribosomal-protein-alanine N-acetyltransferase